MYTIFAVPIVNMDKKFYSKLITLALPIMIQSLMLALVAVADAFMLGNLEQDQMSAVSLATQIQFVQNIIIMSLTAAASTLGAQYWGKGDRATMLKLFNILLKLSVSVSLVFFALCELCPEVLMSIFTNEPVLIEIGAGYLQVAGVSYLMVGISQCYHTMLKVTDHTKQTAIVSTMTVILNIIFNAIFIYGLFGFPMMEARGAALSTVLVRLAELITVVAMSFGKGYLRADLKHFFVRDTLLFKDYVKVMWPLMGAGLLWGVGFTSYTAFMGHLGTDAAAANSICAVIRDCVCCMCDGMAVGGGIMVGNELGAGMLEKGREYGIRIMKISFVVGILSTVVMLALIPAITHTVKLTDNATSLLYGMMAVMAFYMIGRSVNTITINGIFAAGGDTLFDMYSLIVTMWCLAVPLAALGTFVFHWHPVVVYAFTCLDEVGKIPWVIIHFKKYKWVKDLTR